MKETEKNQNLTLSSNQHVVNFARRSEFLHTASSVVHRTFHAIRPDIDAIGLCQCAQAFGQRLRTRRFHSH